jgi:hypothetical protein
MIDTIAMAVAARAVGFHAVADMIERDHLSPEGVARLFRMSARYDRNRAAAVVILAGVVARFSADRGAFDGGDAERALVAALIPRHEIAEADRQAVRITRAHWGEISNGWHSAPAFLTQPRLSGRRN